MGRRLVNIQMPEFNFIKNLNLITLNFTDSRKVDFSVGKNSKKTVSLSKISKRIISRRKRHKK